MQLNGPAAAGLMYSVTGGDGPVVVMHWVLMRGTLRDTVTEGLRDRYGCIVPELPFGAHTTPMQDDAGRTDPGRVPRRVRASTGVARHAVHRVRSPMPDRR